MKVLVLGSSHVVAVDSALREKPDAAFTVHNLNSQTPELIRDPTARSALAAQFAPIDALCLCLGGNLHNILSLLNDPQPFHLAPAEFHGQLVPKDMMAEHIAAKLANLATLARDLMQVLPAQKTFILNPPPPGGDAAHIRKHPGVFAAKIESGVSPDALRLQTYRLQTQIYQDHAREIGGVFLPNPAAAVDSRGFLAEDFWAADPTHANAAYGHLILDILRTAIKDMK